MELKLWKVIREMFATQKDDAIIEYPPDTVLCLGPAGFDEDPVFLAPDTEDEK